LTGINHNTDELLVGLLTQIRLREQQQQQQQQQQQVGLAAHKGNNTKKQVSS
jgi:hypothetical protein